MRLKVRTIENRQRFFVFATDEQVSEPGLPIEFTRLATAGLTPCSDGQETAK